jgi:hypothetical protein
MDRTNTELSTKKRLQKSQEEEKEKAERERIMYSIFP